MNIILLVRSYNRPEYLQQTLLSLLKSDINLCMKRYIYDDGSDNKDVETILNNKTNTNVKNKEFIVIKNKENRGCRLSYTDALQYIKNDNITYSNYTICTLDNDVIVKNNFISELNKYYNITLKVFNTYNILLTGFNPSNAHLNKLKQYNGFYTKETIGRYKFSF